MRYAPTLLMPKEHVLFTNKAALCSIHPKASHQWCYIYQHRDTFLEAVVIERD